MCGDLKPWQYAHTVVIRMETNGAPITVNLGRPLEHVDEVWLTEYAVRGAPAGSDLWRFNFLGNNMPEEVSTNAGGRGHCIMVTPTGDKHQVYDQARVISLAQKQYLNTLTVELRDSTGANVTFTSATIFLTFICNKPHWSPHAVALEDRNKLEWWRSQQFSNRFTP